MGNSTRDRRSLAEDQIRSGVGAEGGPMAVTNGRGVQVVLPGNMGSTTITTEAMAGRADFKIVSGIATL